MGESGTRADARTRINSAEVDREVESASHDTIERFDNNLRLYEERRAQLSNELAQGKKDEAAATGIARWLQASGATDAVRGVLCSHSVCELELRQDQPLEEASAAWGLFVLSLLIIVGACVGCGSTPTKENQCGTCTAGTQKEICELTFDVCEDTSGCDTGKIGEATGC